MLPEATKRVLMLEDDRIMADVLQRSLRRSGLEAVWAKSGVEACEYLTDPFDIVVSDYHMPKMNGEEFVRRLRQSAVNADVPVIFVTGKKLELDVERLQRELGVLQVLSKPFGPRHLIEVIQRCLATEASGGQDARSMER